MAQLSSERSGPPADSRQQAAGPGQSAKGGNPLGYERISVLLRRFAVPSIIAMMVTSLYNIVDQIFIGQGVGYLGNAATNVAYPLTTVCLALTLMIGIGAAAGFSLNLGRGDAKKSAQVAGTAITMMVTVGLLYMIVAQIFLNPLLRAFGATEEVLPYALTYARITVFGMPLLIVTNGISNLARADGSPRYSMLCMIIGAIINTILDPIFIFVFHWGIRGAAAATVIGQIASCIMAVRYIWKFQHIEIRREYYRPELHQCLEICTLGMSSGINQTAITLVQVVLNNSLTYYGAQTIYGSSIPLASAGIVMKTNALLLSVIIGISQGSQPIFGFNYGAKQYQRVRGTYKLAITISTIISVAAFICFQCFPRTIISLFGSGDELYMEFAVRFLRIFLFMVFVLSVQIISSNFFSAIGKPVKGMLLSLTRQVIFLIPLMLILPRFLGLDGLLYAAPAADTMAFLTAVFMVSREMAHMRRLEQEA